MALQGLDNLTRSLSRLPGVGRRSAERMAMKLAADPEGLILPLIGALEETRRTVSFCSRCGAMTAVENDPCRLCTDSKRDGTVVCVVEDPSDIVAMETTGSYTGRYHALMGKISPMRGDGPNDIRIRALVRRIKDEAIEEVLLALNTDIESEATAGLIADILKARGVRVTRLAYGIPAGSGIRYADAVTLDRAIQGRQAL
jgi:recombination protein RecR